MNKPTVKLLKVFRNIHPNSAKMEVNKACYSCSVFGEAELRYELKFWIEELGNNMLLHGECAYAYGYMKDDELKTAMDDLGKVRDLICATCKMKSNSGVCNRVCLYTRLTFNETTFIFTYNPVLVTDIAEAAFRAREFQQLATDTFRNFVQDAGMYLLVEKAKAMRQTPAEPLYGFEGFKPGGPKN